MVRQATETAVSASISTPVCPATFTSAVTLTPGSASSMAQSTITLDSSSGWQSGMSSWVRFAAKMPASRAVPSTSPFLASPSRMRRTVSGVVTTAPSARATRAVTSFSETSTILAAPVRSTWVRSGTASPEQKPPRGVGHIGLAHQALADEERADANRREPLHVRMAEDAALSDDDAIGGHARRKLFGDGKRSLEGAKIPVVDADELGAEKQRAIELARVVHLGQHVHAEPLRGIGQAARLVIGDARHDDEDAVGAPGPRLVDLVGFEQEILAQRRQARGFAGKPQIFGPALEGRPVGQHREAGRAALGIGAGERRGIEIGADEALRRACLLDLRDERGAVFGEVALDRRPEAARRRRLAGAPLDVLRRDPGFCGLDLEPLIGLDAREHVAHGLFETAISRSSAPLAAPESTACTARSTPSRKVLTFSATISAAAALNTAMSRYGVGRPSSAARSSFALCSGSPPLRSSGRAFLSPTSSGAMVNSRTTPFSSATTWVGPVVVISSRPSEPCTVHTRREPSSFKPCVNGSSQAFEGTPRSWRSTPAGLDRGPSRLKSVRVPNSTRAAATWRIEAWWVWANMKQSPASLRQRLSSAGSRPILTPSAVSTSAAPEREEAARLPCFATGTPQPATIIAAKVEML